MKHWLRSGKIKGQLVEKLDAIREVVSCYQVQYASSTIGSKPSGIPFGLSGLNTLAAALMPAADKPITSADRTIADIKRILG